MAYLINDKIKNLQPYEPICDEFEIRLDANESYFDLPLEIQSEIADNIKNIDFNRYPDPYCTELCEYIADFYDADKNCLTIGNGSDELISIIVNSFLKKGDSIITFSPDFSMYNFYAFLSEMNVINIKKKNDLTIDIDEAIKISNENNVKMIIFSNPCNPTSIGLEKKEVINLIKSVNALVVLDEAYMDFWNQSLINSIDGFDNLIILKTASKAFGAAAIRLGFALSTPKITNALKAVKSPYNVNSVTQMIGKVLYKNKNTIQSEIKNILENRDYLYEKLFKILQKFFDRLILYKTNTNFIFIKTPSEKESKQIFKFMKKSSIAVRCLKEYIRVTVGSKEQCDRFLAAFEKILNSMYGGVK